MSLGGSYVQAEVDAVEAAIASGAHVIVAAGNDNADACNYSPAAAPSATTVGATTTIVGVLDWRSVFSNWGSCVDIFAPGSDITSAGHNCDSCTAVLSGTSMACPIVSSLAAIFLEVVPSLSPSSIDYYLKTFATSDVLYDIGAGSPNLLLYTYYQYYAG